MPQEDSEHGEDGSRRGDTESLGDVERIAVLVEDLLSVVH